MLAPAALRNDRSTVNNDRLRELDHQVIVRMLEAVKAKGRLASALAPSAGLVAWTLFPLPFYS